LPARAGAFNPRGVFAAGSTGAVAGSPGKDAAAAPPFEPRGAFFADGAPAPATASATFRFAVTRLLDAMRSCVPLVP